MSLASCRHHTGSTLPCKSHREQTQAQNDATVICRHTLLHHKRPCKASDCIEPWIQSLERCSLQQMIDSFHHVPDVHDSGRPSRDFRTWIDLPKILSCRRCRIPRDTSSAPEVCSVIDQRKTLAIAQSQQGLPPVEFVEILVQHLEKSCLILKGGPVILL